MAIYGTALLSFCLLVGVILGNLLGKLVGVDADVGGVGIAMLLLIILTSKLRGLDMLSTPTQNGVLFWSAIYIPIVTAMAASQNVYAAVSSGTAVIVAGVLVVIVSFAMVPLISKIGQVAGDAPGKQPGEDA